jgi:hypothetical protein
VGSISLYGVEGWDDDGRWKQFARKRRNVGIMDGKCKKRDSMVG